MHTSPSFGPFSIFMGLHQPWLSAVGLCGLSWISCTFRKNTLKKQTYLWPKRRIWRRLGPFPSLWASFSLFVGLRGPSWLLSAPKRGVVGVVQLANLYSKKNTATGICNMAGMHGSLPAPEPAGT